MTKRKIGWEGCVGKNGSGYRGDAKIESIFSAFSLYFFSFFCLGFSVSSLVTAARLTSGVDAPLTGTSPDAFIFEASPFRDWSSEDGDPIEVEDSLLLSEGPAAMLTCVEFDAVTGSVPLVVGVDDRAPLDFELWKRLLSND